MGQVNDTEQDITENENDRGYEQKVSLQKKRVKRDFQIMSNIVFKSNITFRGGVNFNLNDLVISKTIFSLLVVYLKWCFPNIYSKVCYD